MEAKLLDDLVEVLTETEGVDPHEVRAEALRLYMNVHPTRVWEPTASSVRSSFAPAFGISSYLALNSGSHYLRKFVWTRMSSKDCRIGRENLPGHIARSLLGGPRWTAMCGRPVA